MKCEIIRDLLPLYMDGCCSPESCAEVEAHLKTCPDCENARRLMGSALEITRTPSGLPKRIKEWKGSVLQSLCLLLAFAVITVGVSLEAATGAASERNGFWALMLVIPATGLLLSLANWYFVRFYRGTERFCFASCGLCALVCLCAYLWAALHYGFSPAAMLREGVWLPLLVASALAWGVSRAYAALIGKE